MKKLMIAALMMLGTSTAFAGDSEGLKAIMKVKDYAAALDLVNSSLNQLANNQEKAKAYQHLTKLALEKFDKENAVQTANMQAQITKGKESAYDTLGYYEAAYNATVNGLECMKYDAMPDEKGKTKPKFTSELTPLVSNARMQLVTAGNYYATLGDEKGVLKYWGTFLDTDDHPAFAASKANEEQFIGQVAFYSAQFSNQAGEYEKAEKYADIAMRDKTVRDKAESFKYSMAQRNLKTQADSLAFVDKMKSLYAADPKNESIFVILANMYSGLNKNSELDALLNEKVAADPNNFSAWALKGQTLMNRNSTAENPNWDETIDCFKKANAIDGTNTVILTYLGFCLNAKAANAANAQAQKALCQESMGFLEKARELDPNREKANWAYPLYQSYYTVYGAQDNRTKEMEQMLK